MKIQKQRREIVIEFERVQIVRKRAKTHILYCRACRRETDFISLGEAMSFFETNSEQLLRFMQTNFSHFETGADGETYLCLLSLLAAMRARTNISQVKLIGD